MKSIYIVFLLFLGIAIVHKNTAYAQMDQSGQKQGSLGFHTPTPTRTPTPTSTPSPIPTATPIPLPQTCGQQCGSINCQSGLTCITANNGNSYCAKANASTILNCSTNPTTATCCALPTATPTYTPTATPTITNTPIPSPTLYVNMECDPNVTEMNPIYTYQGMVIGYGMRPGRNMEWYYINPSGNTVTQIKDQIDILLAKSQTIAGEQLTFREDYHYFLKDLEKHQNCPIRMTGDSPTLFVYGPIGTRMNISVNKNVLYSDPPISQNSWNTKIQAENIEANGYSREYIYYEYESAGFNRPKTGWNIERADMPKLAADISDALQLDDSETKRLLFELKQALTDVSGNRIFVGMIDRAEVDAKLPMTVSPMPESIARYHFYVATGEATVVPPIIPPLHRTERMLLELGAVGYGD